MDLPLHSGGRTAGQSQVDTPRKREDEFVHGEEDGRG